MTSPSRQGLHPFSLVAGAVVASFDMRDIRGICLICDFILMGRERARREGAFAILRIETLILMPAILLLVQNMLISGVVHKRCR